MPSSAASLSSSPVAPSGGSSGDSNSGESRPEGEGADSSKRRFGDKMGDGDELAPSMGCSCCGGKKRKEKKERNHEIGQQKEKNDRKRAR